MDRPTQFLQLEDGGQIAFQEYGDASGIPVLFCHGWPSSQTMGELTDQAAKEAGVRIISPDRPGIGLSSFRAERTLLDWPPIVRQLMAKLGIEKFRILGISGGAPYAYATGWAMPGEVESIAVVSGAPPIAEVKDQARLLRLYRWMLILRNTRPRLLRRFFQIAKPFASARFPIRLRPLLLKLLHPADAAVLRDAALFEICFESNRRAWRGSSGGVMAEAEIYAHEWGFPLEAIEVPVRLWHGTLDRAFSFRLAEEIGARLPNCRVRIVEGAGHFSLPIRRMHEILADLISV